MIRKAHPSDMSPFDPSPEQIRQRAKAIRKQWTPRERARRSGFRTATWMPPVYSDTELPGYSASDFDTR